MPKKAVSPSPKMVFSPRDRGFTLLELMVVIFIIVTLLTLALPSLDGLFQSQALQGKLDHFHKLVQRARWQAVSQEANTKIIWSESEIALLAAMSAEEEAEAKSADFGPSIIPVAKDEIYKITKLHAKTVASQPGWTFWPSGNCEAVQVSYQGPAGEWSATFDPLCAEYTLETFELP